MNVQATHIVGGEMNYTCLGNDQYEITLTIFRDCFNGNPNAWFDDPAAIGIYNSDFELVDSLYIPLMGNDTLNPVLSDECLVVPPNVCVHTTTYTAIVDLEFLEGGYQLIYQRCCRNRTIENIIDPLDSGATYGVNISERALMECNSSAKFQAWPPIYICVNEPINFDQSAIDVDGDSIVYKLCAPLLGADPDTPQPQPFEQTFPQPVVWNPPFGVDDMLGGIPLRIDPQTGLLTGTPNLIGQFVVGICLEEYREGELISTSRRDFQYNVGLCGETISSFFAPEVQCDGFTVEFDNQSDNADDYLWFFNDPLNPDASSEEANPSYTYSDTGLYEIMLIAEPGNICVDTSIEQVYIQLPSLFPEFEYAFVECTDSLTIQVTDQSYDTISTPVDWFWELSNGQSSSEQNPIFSTTTSGTLTLSLTLTADNGCVQVLEQDFEANLIEEELTTDSMMVCKGTAVFLNAVYDSSYVYEWSPIDGLDDPFSPNPSAMPEETTTYVVTIKDTSNFCQVERSIHIFIPEPLTLDLPNDTTICDLSLELIANTNFGQQFIWAKDNEFDDVLGQGDTIMVSPQGEQQYYLLVRDSLGCSVRDSVKIIGNAIDTDKEDISIICQGEEATLVIQNLDSVDVLSYNWSPTENIIDGLGTATPTVLLDSVGTFVWYVNMENQFACTKSDSIVLAILDTTSQAAFVNSIQCSGYSVQFINESVNAPYYSWDFGDPTQPDANSTDENPSYIYPDTGTYFVTLTVNAAVDCPDTIVKEIRVMEPSIIVDFDYQFEECVDSVLIQFTDLSINNQSNIEAWNWSFSNGEQSDLQNPSLYINESQDLLVQLELSADDECVDTMTQIIPIRLIEAMIPDTVIVCNGVATPLNPLADTTYVYEWSPIDGLDDPFAPNPLANPTATSNYSVTISDYRMDTCQIIREVTVIVPDPIDLEVPNDTSFCDQTYSITATSNNTNVFEWSTDINFDNVISQAATVEVNPGRMTPYYVRAIDEWSCFVVDSVVLNSWSIDVDINNQRTVCRGDTINLSVVNLQDDELTFSWEPAEAIIRGANSNAPLISPLASADYTVTITNEYGCELIDTVSINVLDDIPIVNVDADPDTIVIGQSTQLSTPFGTLYDYQWTPESTLDDPTIFNPTATPEETTLYTLEVNNTSGCTAIGSVLVIVLRPECSDPFIFIPTAFTPNQDGVNDVFEVRGNNVDEMHLAIYNRWGEKVFESRSQSDVWDGTYKGEPLDPDVFGVYLTVKCFNGIEYFKKGNLSLLR